ncbi:MAG: tRNA lysidine(34) synthetase TilS [Chitinophagaceae bacterium]|nr:tRNA lysidine(34) synthetase TilS [Chitinophagaceae bacterium]
MVEEFKKHIEEEKLFKTTDRLLIAISGGVDSVVLTELCHRLGYTMALAHCNFQLRGEESDRDEAFVKELAERKKIPLHIIRFDTTHEAQKAGTSIEETARHLRYAWFDQLITEHGYDRLLTAHHADDNIETVLMHFFRGTGIRGLRGMLPLKGRHVRPMLLIRRAGIEEWATREGLNFVEDSSNQELEFTRNYFRKELIPSIQKKFPATEENILDTIHHMREAEMLYKKALDKQLKRLVHLKGNEVHIPVQLLKKSEPRRLLLWEIVRDFGFHSAQLPDLLHLLDAEPGKYVASSSHRLIQHRQWLVLAPLAGEQAQTILVEGTGIYNFPQGKLELKGKSDEECSIFFTAQTGEKHDILVERKKISFPLVLRTWKTGDYFYPEGMWGKKKKVARFLIDLKLSKTGKEKVWVLESEKKIIWVVGFRKDSRF